MIILVRNKNVIVCIELDFDEKVQLSGRPGHRLAQASEETSVMTGLLANGVARR